MNEAYKSNVVVGDYGQIIEEGEFSEEQLSHTTDEWCQSLTKKQLLGVIAWHFRRDHFCEGSWISDSVAEEHMMVLVDSILMAN